MYVLQCVELVRNVLLLFYLYHVMSTCIFGYLKLLQLMYNFFVLECTVLYAARDSYILHSHVHVYLSANYVRIVFTRVYSQPIEFIRFQKIHFLSTNRLMGFHCLHLSSFPWLNFFTINYDNRINNSNYLGI